MSKKDAIRHLQRALVVADLPGAESYESDADGNTVAASDAYKVGAMTQRIIFALQELGVEVAE